MQSLLRPVALALAATLLASPAFAHVGVGDTTSFMAGFGHPFSGLDHITVMIAVGLWAALKGGKAIWIWPTAFVTVMLVGGALGMAGIPIPFVEPGILASVVALGILVAVAADLPVWTGAVIIGLFAVFHGHAHGAEAPETVAGIEYMAGFAIATAILHGLGIATALAVGTRYRVMARAAGVVCVTVGIGLVTEIL
jgi:urease accessory protein